MSEGAQIDMALALERPLISEPAFPEQTHERRDEQRLEISVVFTTVRPTLTALQQAGALARKLHARITLLVCQIVPYPLPLASPPVLLDFNERRFYTLAKESHVATTVRIYLCRDQRETLARQLKPRSIVVLGGRKRWWPTAEMRLSRSLRRNGHEVVFVETE
jgi:hypothetical protein